MGLLAGLLGSTSGVMIVCYTRALRKVAFDINSAIADKMAEIGASAPATEAVDDDGAEEDLTA